MSKLNKTKAKNQEITKDPLAASNLAKITLRPSANAAAIIAEYGSLFGEQDIAALMDSLNDSVDKVLDGNMEKCEAILMGQAHALQSIFMNLSRRAVKQEYLKQYETYLKLALKAQSQCRATLETLAVIKNPPIVFAKQANIAHGHQQINNGTASTHENNITRADKSQLDQNELLESKHEQRLEQREAFTASNNHQELETVEAVNRTKDK